MIDPVLQPLQDHKVEGLHKALYGEEVFLKAIDERSVNVGQIQITQIDNASERRVHLTIRVEVSANSHAAVVFSPNKGVMTVEKVVKRALDAGVYALKYYY